MVSRHSRMFNYSKMNFKKILVILILLVACYTLFDVSYRLISGTEKAEAEDASEIDINKLKAQNGDDIAANVNQANTIITEVGKHAQAGDHVLMWTSKSGNATHQHVEIWRGSVLMHEFGVNHAGELTTGVHHLAKGLGQADKHIVRGVIETRSREKEANLRPVGRVAETPKSKEYLERSQMDQKSPEVPITQAPTVSPAPEAKRKADEAKVKHKADEILPSIPSCWSLSSPTTWFCEIARSRSKSKPIDTRSDKEKLDEFSEIKLKSQKRYRVTKEGEIIAEKQAS